MKTITQQPNFFVFDVAQPNIIVLCNGDITTLNTVVLSYDNVKITDNSFIVGYNEDLENFNEDILFCFGIKAIKGIVFRKCSVCEYVNLLDGETWENYVEYIKFIKQLPINVICKVKFWFDCDHPIAPNSDVKTGNKKLHVYCYKNGTTTLHKNNVQ